MELDRDALQRDILELYTREHAALGEEGTHKHLEEGCELSGRFGLPATLRAGGVLVFPPRRGGGLRLPDCRVRPRLPGRLFRGWRQERVGGERAARLYG